MDARYIAAAIPLFFALIGIERWINARQGDPGYAFHDSITNLSCGIGQQVLGVFYRLAIVLGYTWGLDLRLNGAAVGSERRFDVFSGGTPQWARYAAPSCVAVV